MKVSIDAQRCQGHGRCYDLAPAVFTEDEEGYGVVLLDVVPAQHREAALLAAANCPEGAVQAEAVA